MDESHFAILLLAVGLALMIAEVFVPSGGIFALLVLLCLAGSVYCAWNAWWETNRTAWWSYLLGLMVLVPATISGAFYALPRTTIGRRVLLEAPDPEEVTPYVAEQKHLEERLGHLGKTLSLLNPGGMVFVDGERFHCESEGILVDPDIDVRVVAVKGLRLVVRPTSFEKESAVDRDFPGTPRQPLDFDISQS